MKKTKEDQNKELEKPTIVEVYNDNGTHSHWSLIDTDTGIKLWSEDSIECKAMGYPVQSQQDNKPVDVDQLRHDFMHSYTASYCKSSEHMERIFKWFEPFLSNTSEDKEAWVSVEKRLPPLNEVVLCFGIDGVTRVRDFGAVEKTGFKMQNKINKKVSITHWATLPQPPKQD